MPNLFLQTEVNPGEAFWGPGGGESSDSLLLLVPIDGVGVVAAPAIDPDGLTNICYVCTATVTGVGVTLPSITNTLPSTWRITLALADWDTAVYVEINAAEGNTIVNSPTNSVLLAGNGGEGSYTPNPNSGTFVHDGDESWAVFYGGGTGPDA